MTVTIVKDRMKAVQATLRALGAKRVLVGIPGEMDAREREPGEKSEPIGNAALGYIQENGSPAANIPPRPFLMPGVRSVREEIAGRFEGAARRALAGGNGNIEQTLNAVGLIAVTAVKKVFDAQGPGWEPLKPGTLAARRRQGFKGTKILLRSGQLRNAVTFVVRDASNAKASP